MNHSKDNNKSNSEAILIRELINELIFCGISEENIGVIAPYRPQLTQIKNELRKLDCNSNKIIVETVE
ncbi:MAG: AAA domain-containing protein, partial [Pseudomonadota bacterium]